MENHPTLIGSKEENWKIETPKKSFLVIVLSMLYFWRGSFKQFNYYGYQTARWTVTFLEVPQDCVGLIFIKGKILAFVSLMCIIKQVVLGTI